MVARLNSKMSLRLTRHWIWHARSGLTALTMVLILLTNCAQAQNFINQSTGTYKGPGLFQIKGLATGLPDTVTGTFEFFGVNQTVPSSNYTNLFLTGSGSTKSSQGGNVGILQTAKVDTNVTFQVHTNDTLRLNRLNGQLTETGLVIGRIHKTVNLAGGTNSSDFGGIGLSISWLGINPGYTSVTRTSGTAISINGKSSIQRFFDIKAATDSLLNANLSFTFCAGELQGQNPSTLDLWRSPDGGLSWRRQRVSRGGNTITRTNIPTFGSNGRWTASDANNLLGIANYEWEADSLKSIAGNKHFGHPRLLSDTAFVARVVDAFNQPIYNQNVRFAIIDTPAYATGQSLTATNVTSDSLGQVSTRLTFGSIRGNYRVEAFIPGLPSAIDTFLATAKSTITTVNAQAPVLTDSIKSVITPIVITVKDQDGVPVPFTQVTFAMSAPDTNYRMSNSTVMTDTSGKATTSITFGKKSGSILVQAVSVEDTTAKGPINLTALPGEALKIYNSTTDGLAKDTVMKVKQFKINLYDSELNGRKGDTILLSWTNSLNSSSLGDSLYTSFVVIDTNGNAPPVLARLGTKSLTNYALKAYAKSKPALSSTQTITATNDVASKMIAGTTAFNDTIGARISQLSMLVNDRYNNAVLNAPVSYSILSRPDTIGKLDSAVVLTDSLGTVSNAITLGTKVGMYTVQASLNGIRDTFKVFTRPGIPLKLLAMQATYQSKKILQPLDSVFKVKLTDRTGNPIIGDTVRFAIMNVPTSASGQFLDNTIARTDSQGIATARLTLGNKVGKYSIFATSPKLVSVIDTFDAHASQGDVNAIAYDGGNRQQKTILNFLDTLLAVKLTDVGGNATANESVRFTLVKRPQRDSLASFSTTKPTTDTTVVSDSLGRASIRFKMGSRVGVYQIIATCLIPDTLKFNDSATVGVPFALNGISGNAQLGQIGDRISPFIVRLADIGDNDIAGKTVTFQIIEKPQFAIRDTLTSYSALTDSAGQAYTQLTLGSRSGDYKVKASATGLKDTIFSASAICVVADANHDNYQNIADLTAVIDYFIGRRQLTDAEFQSADIWPRNSNNTFGDGIVDLHDVLALRDSLLAGAWNPSQNWIPIYLPPTPHVSSKIKDANSSNRTLGTLSGVESIIQRSTLGSRFSMKNTIPVKAIQAILFLRAAAVIDTADVIFPRAKMMNVKVKSVGKQVNMIVYNNTNTPILPDSGAIFRMPIQLGSIIDSMFVLVSIDSNVAAMIPATTQDITTSLPQAWMLYQNYPNPFNPTTTITFDIPEVAGKVPRVAIQIYNILGQKVKTIERGNYDAGRYEVVWNGSNDANVRVASGVYFYRLLAGDYVSTKKMVLIK